MTKTTPFAHCTQLMGMSYSDVADLIERSTNRPCRVHHARRALEGREPVPPFVFQTLRRDFAEAEQTAQKTLLLHDTGPMFVTEQDLSDQRMRLSLLLAGLRLPNGEQMLWHPHAPKTQNLWGII